MHDLNDEFLVNVDSFFKYSEKFGLYLTIKTKPNHFVKCISKSAVLYIALRSLEMRIFRWIHIYLMIMISSLKKKNSYSIWRFQQKMRWCENVNCLQSKHQEIWTIFTPASDQVCKWFKLSSGDSDLHISYSFAYFITISVFVRNFQCC